MNARQPVPLRPDPSALGAEWHRSLIRATTCRALSQIQNNADAEEILNRSWPDDARTALILRGPVEPLKQSGVPGNVIVQLMTLAPAAAAARLFELAVKIDLSGITQVSFPLPTSFTAAMFIEEGAAIPVGQGAFTGMLLGPIKKVALIAALTNELERASGGAAAVIIEHVLKVAVGRGLDAVLFDNIAGDTIRPPGLLFGATAVTGSADMAKDLSVLVGSIAAAGIDTSSVVFVAAAEQAVTLKLTAGPHFDHRVISANIASGTVIAVGVAGLAVAGSGAPVIDIAKQTTLHVSAPASPISTPGAPAAIAAPTRDLLQTDVFALRCTARITWAAAPGSVAVVTGTTW